MWEVFQFSCKMSLQREIPTYKRISQTSIREGNGSEWHRITDSLKRLDLVGVGEVVCAGCCRCVSCSWSHYRSARLAIGEKSWRSCRSGCHPCQQGEPADQWQCAWSARVPGARHQTSEHYQTADCFTLTSKSHANVSCSRCWPGTTQGREFWRDLAPA